MTPERLQYIRDWSKSNSEPLHCHAMRELLEIIDASTASYETGFDEAAKLAIECCERRAAPEDKSMSLRQEAKKCASAIEWYLLETDPCPYCEGSGWHHVDFEHPQSMACDACHATGRVKKGTAS